MLVTNCVDFSCTKLSTNNKRMIHNYLKFSIPFGYEIEYFTMPLNNSQKSFD